MLHGRAVLRGRRHLELASLAKASSSGDSGAACESRAQALARGAVVADHDTRGPRGDRTRTTRRSARSAARARRAARGVRHLAGAVGAAQPHRRPRVRPTAEHLRCANGVAEQRLRRPRSARRARPAARRSPNGRSTTSQGAVLTKEKRPSRPCSRPPSSQARPAYARAAAPPRAGYSRRVSQRRPAG